MRFDAEPSPTSAEVAAIAAALEVTRRARPAAADAKADGGVNDPTVWRFSLRDW